MNYRVEFGYGASKYTKTFSSIEELKDYCCQNWGVQRFQVKIDTDGNEVSWVIIDFDDDSVKVSDENDKNLMKVATLLKLGTIL